MNQLLVRQMWVRLNSTMNYNLILAPAYKVLSRLLGLLCNHLPLNNQFFIVNTVTYKIIWQRILKMGIGTVMSQISHPVRLKLQLFTSYIKSAVIVVLSQFFISSPIKLNTNPIFSYLHFHCLINSCKYNKKLL